MLELPYPLQNKVTTKVVEPIPGGLFKLHQNIRRTSRKRKTIIQFATVLTLTTAVALLFFLPRSNSYRQSPSFVNQIQWEPPPIVASPQNTYVSIETSNPRVVMRWLQPK